MQWHDQAVILSMKKFGESKMLVTVLSHKHGKQTGLVNYSVRSKSSLSVLQVGNIVHVSWNARLVQHLGQFKIESVFSPAPALFQDVWKLWSLQSCCSLLNILPQAHPYDVLYEHLVDILKKLMKEEARMVLKHLTLFEKEFLAELGFGIDIHQCCVTFTTNDLCYISPKTGRAVCKNAGIDYINRLLPLPAYWLDSPNDNSHIEWEQLYDSFKVTEYFMKKWLPQLNDINLYARDQLIAFVQKNCAADKTAA